MPLSNNRPGLSSLKLVGSTDQATGKMVICVTHKSNGPICSLVLKAWDRHHKLQIESVYDLIYRTT